MMVHLILDVEGPRASTGLCVDVTSGVMIDLGFEMSLIVFEAVRGRCASFMVPTAKVSEIFVLTDKLFYFSRIYCN